MPRSPAPPRAAFASAEAAEAAFYEALQAGDAQAVMRVWADDEEPVCVHPGGSRLVGLAAIAESYEQLLAAGGMSIVAESALRSVTPGCSVHSVVERLGLAPGAGAVCVLATNVYLRTPQGWRLVLHHASPGTLEDADAWLAQSERLH